MRLFAYEVLGAEVVLKILLKPTYEQMYMTE